MRKFLAIAVIALTAAFGAGTADAQVRIKIMTNPGIGAIKQRGPRIPRVNPVRPKILLIPPSRAVKLAQRAFPNTKPLKVTPSGKNYIVSLKSGGTIRRVMVDAVTGAVTSGP